MDWEQARHVPHRVAASVTQRYDPGVDEGPARGLVERTLPATRGWVIAEALLLVMVGFTADDVQLLRFPGYLLGLASVLLVLAFGGLVHARRLAHRLEALDEDAISSRIRSARDRGVFLAVLAALGFLAWLVLFGQGVPPWAL